MDIELKKYELDMYLSTCEHAYNNFLKFNDKKSLLALVRATNNSLNRFTTIGYTMHKPRKYKIEKNQYNIHSKQLKKLQKIVESICVPNILPQNPGNITTDCFAEVLRYLSPEYLIQIMTVCKHWLKITNMETIWKNISCKLLDTSKPDGMSWQKWAFRLIHFGEFDASILHEEIFYDSTHKGALKLQTSPDISIAFIGWPLRSGKVYVEFVCHSIGCEIYIGVTHRPEDIVKCIGMDIVSHPFTWAYTDGRRFGIQYGGKYCNANRFTLGDKVGLFLDMDANQVSFYKNKVQEESYFQLLQDESYQIFLMLDEECDRVIITDFTWGTLPFKTFD